MIELDGVARRYVQRVTPSACHDCSFEARRFPRPLHARGNHVTDLRMMHVKTVPVADSLVPHDDYHFGTNVMVRVGMNLTELMHAHWTIGEKLGV